MAREAAATATTTTTTTYEQAEKRMKRRRRIDNDALHRQLALLRRGMDVFVREFGERLDAVATMTFYEGDCDLRHGDSETQGRPRARRGGRRVQRSKRLRGARERAAGVEPTADPPKDLPRTQKKKKEGNEEKTSKDATRNKKDAVRAQGFATKTQVAVVKDGTTGRRDAEAAPERQKTAARERQVTAAPERQITAAPERQEGEGRVADLTFSSRATCARSAVGNPQNGAQAATESSDPRCSQVAAVTWSEYRQMEAKAVRLEEEAEKAAGKRDALRARNKVAMQEQQKRIGQLEGWLQEQGEKAEERVAALKARVEEMEQDKKAVQQQWGSWERIAAVELASEKERAAGLQTRVGKAEERVAELQARVGKAEVNRLFFLLPQAEQDRAEERVAALKARREGGMSKFDDFENMR